MTIPNCVLAEIQLPLIEIVLRQFQTLPGPKFNCPSSKLFYDNANLCVSRNSIPSHRNCSKTIPNCVVTEVQLPLIETIVRQFQIVSLQKHNSYHRNCSKTIPKRLFAEIHLHLLEFFLRQFQIVS